MILIGHNLIWMLLKIEKGINKPLIFVMFIEWVSVINDSYHNRQLQIFRDLTKQRFIFHPHRIQHSSHSPPDSSYFWNIITPKLLMFDKEERRKFVLEETCITSTRWIEQCNLKLSEKEVRKHKNTQMFVEYYFSASRLH